MILPVKVSFCNIKENKGILFSIGDIEGKRGIFQNIKEALSFAGLPVGVKDRHEISDVA